MLEKLQKEIITDNDTLRKYLAYGFWLFRESLEKLNNNFFYNKDTEIWLYKYNDFKPVAMIGFSKSNHNNFDNFENTPLFKKPHILDLQVLEEYKGNKLGLELIDEVQNYVDDDITLQYREDWLINLYKNYGFEEVDFFNYLIRKNE